MPLRSEMRSSDITAPGPKRKTHWRTFVTLMTWVCRACYIDGKRGAGVLICFPNEVCHKTDIYPIHKVPNWQPKIKRLIASHYKAHHPTWPFVIR